MHQQLKAATAIGAVTLALFSATPALADNSSVFPSSAREFSSLDVIGTTSADRVTPPASTATTTAFPSSAREFSMIDELYTGTQFDKMNDQPKGALTRSERTDKKMMAGTFPSAAIE